MHAAALFACVPLCTFLLFSASWAHASAFDACMQAQLRTAADTVTIGDLREQCLRLVGDGREAAPPAEESVSPDAQGAVVERLDQEKQNVLRPFTIMPHRPNYILPVVYNTAGYNPDHHRVAHGNSDYDFDSAEAQFQISIKTPLAVDLFNTDLDIYAAYTNRSFWQVYNRDESSPFRETNHEPELWMQFNPRFELFGIVNTSNSLGINHQSNGQSGELSRSWNRLFAAFTFQYGDLGLTVTPWYRIQESESKDDNPDLTDYMGHYSLLAVYKHNRHTFSLMTRNCLESDFQKGAVEFGWSFPLWSWPYLRGYLQYFTGYGESLLDYDQYSNRLGIGLSLSDWL
ncbi:MAG: phospholipase A [Desulfobulbus sp.]|jgi:phospholipase A1